MQNPLNQAPDVKYMDIIDEKLLEKINEDDKRMLNYLGRLYTAINGETLNLSEIENTVDALAKFNERQEYNYLNNLIHPEKCKGVKLPSPIPVPSAAFQLHNSITLSTNASGNLGIVFNPFFLYEKGAGSKQTGSLNGLFQVNPANKWCSGEASVGLGCNYMSSFWVNNDVGLKGNASGQGVWKAINIGQGIPNVYDQYRLVSASIVIKYIGRLDIVSGVIGGAIVFDENKYIGTDLLVPYNSELVSSNAAYPTNPALDKYSNFDLAMDSFYHQEQLCLEGCRELYFPVDNTFEEYMKLLNQNYCTVIGDINETSATTAGVNITADQDYYKSGFNFMIYVLGAPPSSSCFKVDIYCNYECLPNAEFLNYMPISMSPSVISPSDKAYAIKQTQNRAIQKANSESERIEPKKSKSVWQSLKDSFNGGLLPSIGKMVMSGIIDSVPAFKIASSLVGGALSAMSGASTNASSNFSNINPLSGTISNFSGPIRESRQIG